MDSISGISYYLSKFVSRYETLCRQQYYLPLRLQQHCNTAHACTSAWCAQHCSTATTQNSVIASELCPPNRPELNSINYEIYGVYASVNMSFNKVDEIRQRLVELWKSRNTTFQ